MYHDAHMIFLKCTSRTPEELDSMSERVYKQHTDEISYAISVMGRRSSDASKPASVSPNLPSLVSQRQSSSTKHTGSKEAALFRENHYFGNVDIEVRIW